MLVIKSFQGDFAEKLFNRQRALRFPTDLHRIAHRKLLMVHAAKTLDDLKVPPGNRLEKLVGSRAGSYSIRINDKWRVCFRWSRGDAYDVEVTDYH